MKIGYLGPIGSFTYMATKKITIDAQLIPYPTIYACLEAKALGVIDFAIVPIENSIEGVVSQTIDNLFHQFQLTVQGEIVLPISQQLMVNKKQVNNWRKVTAILSHPQAIEQSQQFLTKYFPEIAPTAMASTATAAEYISQRPEQPLAAIGPKSASDMYDLVIVSENIQDTTTNQTRFWILGDSVLSVEAKPTSNLLSITVMLNEDAPGNLHQVLSAFSWRNINLTNINSRPLKTVLGEHFFYIDIQCNQPNELMENALEEIRLLGGIVQVLGIYPVYHAKQI